MLAFVVGLVIGANVGVILMAIIAAVEKQAAPTLDDTRRRYR